MPNAMEEVKHQCDCHTPYMIGNKYWKAIMNGCLNCMKKYKVTLQLCDGGYVCSLHYTEVWKCGCDPYINIVQNKIPAFCFRYYIDKFIASKSPQVVLNVFELLRTHMSFSINKLSLEQLPVLSLDQLQTLIQMSYVPTEQFWKPYIKKRLFHIIIKVKQIFNSYEQPVKYKIRNSIRAIDRIIQPYISTKVNLYIMKRANLLCPDISKYIERFMY